MTSPQIGFGQTWIKPGPRGGVSNRVFIRSAQLEALNPELARVDIEYLPSGRMRHLRMPDAQALLSKWQLVGEGRADG